MELKEFITQTIQDVVGGITDARAKLPHNYSSKEENERHYYEMTEMGIELSFDLVVGETTTSGNKRGLSVLFAGIGAGAKTESGTSSQSSNRVSFKIPVVVPVVSGDILKMGDPVYNPHGSN